MDRHIYGYLIDKTQFSSSTTTYKDMNSLEWLALLIQVPYWFYYYYYYYYHHHYDYYSYSNNTLDDTGYIDSTFVKVLTISLKLSAHVFAVAEHPVEGP